MAYEYKRRRPSILRNLWVYRRLILAAILLGVMLWFIMANSAPATVEFPFGLGKLNSSVGVVSLMSALVGSVVTVLVTTLVLAVRRMRGTQTSPEPPNQPNPGDDRPPPDYAAKTADGFPNAHWTN
jgi:uncharacterized integral membrane protein